MYQPFHRTPRAGLLHRLLIVGALIAAPAIATAAPIDAPLRFTSPRAGASDCSVNDFGAVQIRIGLHATLRACYQDVPVQHDTGTAFITVPREFEGRAITAKQFAELRADIVATENGLYEQAKRERQGREPVPQARPKPIPLGIFDHDTNRVGYAYAYAVPRTDENGKPFAQAMMRLESFVLVRGHVLVLMMIAPVRGGDDAADTFDLSENWARSIIAENQRIAPAIGSSQNGQPGNRSAKEPEPQKTGRRLSRSAA